MGAALSETQKLKDVADGFERDLYQQKLAEAEARMAEAEALRERITELEEENAGGSCKLVGGLGLGLGPLLGRGGAGGPCTRRPASVGHGWGRGGELGLHSTASASSRASSSAA